MTALITPFKNQKVDEVSFEKLIKRQIKHGIDVVVPVGTTGESATLTHDEHRICIEIAVDACKGTNVKVLAGAGSNATHEAIGIAKFAQAHLKLLLVLLDVIGDRRILFRHDVFEAKIFKHVFDR